MRLHRAQAKPDWEFLPAAQHNRWQRWASQSGGVLTPGNLITAAGACLAAAGLACVGLHEYWLGIALIGAGRLCDILDGIVAESTDTKSPLGEAVDATIDKLIAYAAFAVVALTGIVPWPLALVLWLQNATNATIVFTAQRQGLAMHASRAGKIGTALEWIAILLFVARAAAGLEHAAMFTAVTYGTTVIAFGLSTLATIRYARVYQRLRAAPRVAAP